MENKRKLRVNVDLDGVLTNWLGSGCRTCGVDENNPEIRKQLKKDIWLDDIIDKEEMWNKINARSYSWWEELELLPWAKDLVNALLPLGDFAFLTSPGDMVKHTITAANAAHGKVLWCNKNFKGIPLIIAHDKHLCANGNSILIDDSTKKIKLFVESGGRGILWPNQYKFLDGELDVDEHIKKLVAMIKCS